MARRIVDLSMPVHPDMLTFPRVPPPALCVYESHEQFAERIGAAAYGVDSLTGSYLVVANDHVGTHLDARKHIVPTAGGPETIPLEWCYSDGVILDFRSCESGYGITADDVRRELDRIEVQLKPYDIVLNWTGAGEYNTEERYRTDHPRHDRGGRALPDLAGRAADGRATRSPTTRRSGRCSSASSSGRRTG